MDLNLQPEQSAELPVMPDAVVELVKMLDRGETYDGIYHAMINGEMVNGIADTNFGDDLRILLHSLSPKMLRSVLMKTLGPDLYDPDFATKANEEYIFKSNGPGAYVAFVSIEGRKGKFLCARELRELIRLLQRYVQAVDAYQRQNSDDIYGSSQLTDADKAAMVQAMEIDDISRFKTRYQLDRPNFEDFNPRWKSQSRDNQMQSGRNVHISDPILSFISMLEKRLLPDVDEEIYQMQSPLMVGNAGYINQRAECHLPSPHIHDKTPKLWGLLLSCLYVMGFKLRVRYATLFRAWQDKEQVNLAEVLGTILAGSLISMDGCNVKQPGTRGADNIPDSEFDCGKKYVFAGIPWFRENLKHSLNTRSRKPPSKNAIIQLRESVGKGREDQKRLKALDDQIKQKKAALIAAKDKYNKVYEEVISNLQHSDAVIKELDEFQSAMDKVGTYYPQLFPPNF
ncbi:uncharacterized protein F4817DRAFT_137408 [Daldinia loculata]|uniref:uncharacterized protein n=1 Tax=Daldinia loculata TaxID=103429 RepID=UPI0020C3D96A|nr:uncharacterized protein F4817DRAFT_137408 [Daldinia loculata]KAI1651649.1 hypothetical protein F4817DRAFT_137408 [Daldinia loculata]